MLHKEYHTLPNGQEIKFSISFNRDRTNFATYEPKKIGYQVSATPVKRSKGEGFNIEEYGAFTGFNDNLIEVERQSAKRLQSAIAELHSRLQKYLDWFTAKKTVSISSPIKFIDHEN